MAVRVEELQSRRVPGRVYRFPTGQIRRRRRAQIMRRRLTLGLVLITCVAAFLLATGQSGIAPASVSRAPRAVVVQPGQTLWDVAARFARPGTDPRAYVQAILQVNHLGGPPQAGTRIRLPR